MLSESTYSLFVEFLFPRVGRNVAAAENVEILDLHIDIDLWLFLIPCEVDRIAF